MSKSISREKAIELLWEAGELSYKLTPPQLDIKKGILQDDNKISVVLCSRRLGKTFLMCTMAIEECLRRPNAIVKYAFPKSAAAKKMLLPVMRKVLEDCPKHLRPEYMVADKEFRFPNGSAIQISGTDNGNIENLRGGDSHLNVVDEAGYCSDLTWGVRAVLGPTTKITKGRTILVSTPSRSESHDFIQDWVLPYQVEGRIRTYTIYDNPQFNEEAIREALSEYPEGANDSMFRREYLCEIVRDSEKTILPSFTDARKKVIVTDQYTRPVYCDKYV
ncbi:MAG: terminase family protein, partial [Bacteroidetes bacterium]|nr:terminase family protein [Bacteroidota bacterium]